MPRSWKVRFLLGVFVVLFVADYLEARPGGGSSSRSRSSGGGSSRSSSGGSSRSSFGGSSSSSGGGGGNLPPEAVLIILVAFVAIPFGAYLLQSKNDSANNISTSGFAPDKSDLARIRQTAQKKLAALRQRDPSFSETLFLDYAQNVFHQYYGALGTDNMGKLRPFFFQPPSNPAKFRYSEIVINAMYITHVADVHLGGKDYERIHVMMETNFTEINKENNARRRFLSEQEWSFVREKDTASLPPAKMQTLACPSCGAPESFHDDTTCRACGTTIEPAAMQWAVILHRTVYEESYTQNSLVTYEEEVGTNDPTIFDAELAAQKQAFTQIHGIGDFAQYFDNFKSQVAKPAFKAIYAAWTARNLQPVRHLVSDFFYQTQQFWIDEYKNQGITNYLDDINIGNITLARIDTDKYYETFTVRIFADCKSYVLRDSDQRHMGGDRKNPRPFSEYWTFVRRIGTERPAKDSLDLDNCPSCAAPLDKMGMTGTCGYCSHKVSTGEFSWVLSRITQDEAYC